MAIAPVSKFTTNDAPKETIIYQRRGIDYFEVTISLLCCIAGVLLLVFGNSYRLGVVLAAIGFVQAIWVLRRAGNKIPLIILNEEGIKTKSTRFYSWADITGEEVVSENNGNAVQPYLRYITPAGEEVVMLKGDEIEKEQLGELLREYRSRNDKMKSS